MVSKVAVAVSLPALAEEAEASCPAAARVLVVVDSGIVG